MTDPKRRIIVCLDGTWDAPEAQTNVEIFYKSVDDTVISPDGYKQYSQYFEGVGTITLRLLGGLFGVGISQQIMNAYSYICSHHIHEEDEIWCIGFSRGSYAARSLCGMIYNVGLLQPEKVNKFEVEKAYHIYRNRNENTKPGKELALEFRNHHSTKMPIIKFLGCFDTVGQLGVPKLPWYLGGTLFYNLFQGASGFHDTKIVPILSNAYHALSIHDQREWFQPTMMDYATSEKKVDDQRVEQVWFPGFHSDVGGGYGTVSSSGAETQNSSNSNGDSSSSNNIGGEEGGEVEGETIRNDLLLPSHSLAWMMRKALDHGLVFKPEARGLLLPSKEGRFIYEDSYKNLYVYQAVPRKDRVIPPLEESGVYKSKQIFEDGNLLSYMTPAQLGLYLSKTLTEFDLHLK